MSHRWQPNTTDPSGRVLVRPLRSEPLRDHAVWAVYEFQQDSMGAIAQSSGLLDLATATSTADALNSSRKQGHSYFKVFRLAGAG